jgi:predicted component of type VI protein secretion system
MAILAKQEANRAQADQGTKPSEAVPTVPEGAGGQTGRRGNIVDESSAGNGDNGTKPLVAPPEPTGPVKTIQPKTTAPRKTPPTPSEMLLSHGVSEGVFPNDYEMTRDERAAIHPDVAEGMTTAQRRQMGSHISEDLAGNATAGMTAEQQARYEAGMQARYSATKEQRVAEAIEHYKDSPDANLRKLAAYADAEGTGRTITKPVESFNHGDEFYLGKRHFRVEVDADGNTHFIDTDMVLPYAEGDMKYSAGTLKKAPTMGDEEFAPAESGDVAGRPKPTTGQGSLLGERYEGSNIGSRTPSMFGDTSKGPASGLEAEQSR